MAKTDYRQYRNLITADEVVSKAMTNVNMDTSIIDDNIVLIAELTHLKPHLGDYFWGELRRKHHAGSLVAVETTLLRNYILPCLSFYVKYELLNDMQYNTTSSGIVTNDDDWSNPADSSELSILKEDTFRKAEILLKDMMEWLDDDDNNGVYPEYESSQNDMHINGDNVVRLGGILAYGNKMNRYRSINKKDERYYN
jgi:hypothetical protein|tara:strand:- start:9036 stop:9626 length:591 start_codon:yes stop_codon:yes gene_type:complete